MVVALRASLEEQRRFFIFQVIWLRSVGGQERCVAFFTFFGRVKTRDAIENRSS